MPTKSILDYRPQTELNVASASFGKEIGRRVPWILFSVAAGIVMVLVGKTYEEQLSQKIQLVFFIPMIVYMSDSIGTETLALFVREIALKRITFKQIFLKEVFVGITLGLASGIPMGLFSYFVFEDLSLALVIAIAMLINGLIAVLVGMCTPFLFARLGKDPAVGTDEITTALSDNLSMVIYLVVASAVLFGFS